MAGRNRAFSIFDIRRMEIAKTFSLDDENIVDLKRVSFGVDVNYSKLLCGTSSGEIKVYDISERQPTKKCEVRLDEKHTAMPFTLFSEFMDSAYVADFNGFVHVVDLKSTL